MRDEPKIQKPRAEMHWEYGAGYYFDMDMDCWLSGVARSLIEFMKVTYGGDLTEVETDFGLFVRQEILPYWPLLSVSCQCHETILRIDKCIFHARQRYSSHNKLLSETIFR